MLLSEIIEFENSLARFICHAMLPSTVPLQSPVSMCFSSQERRMMRGSISVSPEGDETVQQQAGSLSSPPQPSSPSFKGDLLPLYRSYCCCCSSTLLELLLLQFNIPLFLLALLLREAIDRENREKRLTTRRVNVIPRFT